MSQHSTDIEHLYRTHIERATRLAFLLGAGADAEDVAETALMRCLGRLGAVRDADRFTAYVDRAVARAAVDAHRTSTRRAGREARSGASRPDGADHAVTVAERIDVMRALDRLTPDQRAVVVLKYWLDCSEKEIAAALGCRRGTVKSRLARALTELKGAFDG